MNNIKRSAEHWSRIADELKHPRRILKRQTIIQGRTQRRGFCRPHGYLPEIYVPKTYWRTKKRAKGVSHDK
jgi:hypothetical protein